MEDYIFALSFCQLLFSVEPAANRCQMETDKYHRLMGRASQRESIPGDNRECVYAVSRGF